MKRHLFLEGPVQSGKSTILRQLLEPHIDYTGGFASQRLLDSYSQTRGFRIGAAGCTALTSPFSKGYDGVFRISNDDGTVDKYPEVFENKGVEYLIKNQGKKVILLDEIGGAELLGSRFRQALYEVLGGSTPCIGVIKLIESADFMVTTSDYPRSIIEYNRELRRKITEEYGGKIVRFTKDDDAVIKEIEDFLCGIFTIK
ncbi:MAG: hypothetical protein GX663_07405 [Clostridiales bacterium]|nr:hypothetical protein [Clostridiales bacterium]